MKRLFKGMPYHGKPSTFYQRYQFHTGGCRTVPHEPMRIHGREGIWRFRYANAFMALYYHRLDKLKKEAQG